MTDTDLPLWVETLGHPQDEASETFLLLHGYGGSTFSWRTWAPYLAARGHVVQVDMKGFGRAPKPDDGRYAPADLAEGVRRLILERDLQRLTLVGHSLGGGVALLTALDLLDREGAQRLHRMVIVAGAAYRQRLPPFVALGRRPRLAHAAMRWLGPRFVVAQALRAIVFESSDITGDQIRGYAAPMGSPEMTRSLLAAARQIVPPDLDSFCIRYPRIKAPTLLLWGRHDPAVPLWVGERLARELPSATLHILERCGHLPAEERPHTSLAALHAFFQAHP